MVGNNVQTADSAEGDGPEREVSALDTATYIFQMANEMAALAEEAGFARISAALELARDLAGEAMAAGARQSGER